jgi:hypothetical protein
MNTAIWNFPKLVELIDSIGGKVGPFENLSYSATKMIKFMASESSSLIFQYMVSNKIPFSMILDGTTDITGNHVVLMYF